jgi:hypothetical protein
MTTSVPSSTSMGRNNIQHSNSSSTLRMTDSHHQVTYMPQPSIPITMPRSQSVHPLPSYTPDTLSASSLSNRRTSTSSTPTGGTTITRRGIGPNNIPLTRKSITAYENGTFRVVFSDDSELIIRAKSYDNQKFIDAQGKEYLFDRRQPHQPEAIQERLALFYQNEYDAVDHNTSQ